MQCCGDAHLSNFGVFASPERELVFDVNDFDETLPGPWEWDVKRLAASFAIAGAHGASAPSGGAGFARAGAYRTAMREFAAMRNLDVWYARLDVEPAPSHVGPGGPGAAATRRDRPIAKARRRTACGPSRSSRRGRRRAPHRQRPAADRPDRGAAAEDRDRSDRRRHPDLLRRTGTLPGDRRRLLERYHYVDMARKVVGVGSVGTRAWIVLLLGRDDRDPLFLQFKEAPPSVLEPFLGRSEYRNHGQRVVDGQRLMQAASDIFLGWIHLTGADGQSRDFYVRQLRDWKGSAEIERMVPPGMQIYAELCGWTLARAHARSGDRVAIAAYLGKGDVFDRAISAFAEAYADQNERDYAALRARSPRAGASAWRPSHGSYADGDRRCELEPRKVGGGDPRGGSGGKGPGRWDCPGSPEGDAPARFPSSARAAGATPPTRRPGLSTQARQRILSREEHLLGAVAGPVREADRQPRDGEARGRQKQERLPHDDLVHLLADPHRRRR